MIIIVIFCFCRQPSTLCPLKTFGEHVSIKTCPNTALNVQRHIKATLTTLAPVARLAQRHVKSSQAALAPVMMTTINISIIIIIIATRGLVNS